MQNLSPAPMFSSPLPSLDGGMGNPKMITQEQRAKLDKIINAPSDISGWSLL